MELIGKISRIQGNQITIDLGDSEKMKGLNFSKHITLQIADERQVTTKQRNFAYAIMADIARAEVGGAWAGYPEQVYSYFKLLFAYYFDDAEFSLSQSRGNREDANKFIDLLLKFCLRQNIELRKRPLEWLESDFIYKYEYQCLINKKCVICGTSKNIEFAHCKAIGFVNSREKMNHKGWPGMALCHDHHINEQHTSEWGIKKFMEHNHLNGVPVDKKIAKIYGLNYWEEDE